MCVCVCVCVCVQLQVKLLCILLMFMLSLYLCAGSALGNVDKPDQQEVLHTEGRRLAACDTMPTQPAQSSSSCQAQLELASPQPMPSPLLQDSFLPQPIVPPQLGSPSVQGLLPSPQLSAPPPQPAIRSVKIISSPELPQLHQELSTASPQLPKASPESHWASTEVPKASLNPLTASPVQQPPLPQQPSLLQAQRQPSRPPSSPPVAIKPGPARHRGLPAKIPEPLVDYDSSEDSGCDSDPHWGFSVADVLTSGDEETDDELQADLRALRAEAMRPDRHISRRRPASLSHRPNRDESALRVGGRALQEGSRSSFSGAAAVVPDITAQAAASALQARAAAPGPAAKPDASALGTALRAGNDASASGHNRVSGALTGPPVDVSAVRASDTAKGTGTPTAAASASDAKAAATDPSGAAFMHRVRTYESTLRAAASAPDTRADATTAEAVPSSFATAAEEEGTHGNALEASPARADASRNASATSITRRADTGALNMPTPPALLTQHAQQEEDPHQAFESTSADTVQLSDEDSADSLPPWDPASFWQADSSVWDDAHAEAAQTYEVCDDSSQVHGSTAVGSGDADAATAAAAVGGRDAAVAVQLLDPRSSAVQEMHSCSQAVLPSSQAVPPPAVVSEVDTQLVHSPHDRHHYSSSSTTELPAASSSEECQSSEKSDQSRAAASSPDRSPSVRAQSLAAVGMAGHHDDTPDLGEPDSSLQHTAAEDVQCQQDTDISMPEQGVQDRLGQEDQGEGGAGEQCKEELREGRVVDSSPGYTNWLAGSMLKRGEEDAHSRGGQMAPLGDSLCPKSCWVFCFISIESRSLTRNKLMDHPYCTYTSVVQTEQCISNFSCTCTPNVEAVRMHMWLLACNARLVTRHNISTDEKGVTAMLLAVSMPLICIPSV